MSAGNLSHNAESGLVAILGAHGATSVTAIEDLNGHPLVDCVCGVILGTTHSPDIPERHNLHVAKVLTEYLSVDHADSMVEAPCVDSYRSRVHDAHDWLYDHTLRSAEWRHCPGRRYVV